MSAFFLRNIIKAKESASMHDLSDDSMSPEVENTLSAATDVAYATKYFFDNLERLGSFT